MKNTKVKDLLGKFVEVKIDRPLGSKHPRYSKSIIYPINYGYIPDTLAPDGDELDTYVIGPEKPLKTFKGKVTAIIKRLDDEEDKLVVVPEDVVISDEEIEKEIYFQEKWFKHELIR